MNHINEHESLAGSSGKGAMTEASSKRKRAWRPVTGVVALGLLAGCAVESGEGELVDTAADALYMTGAAWPNGTVRVCWSASSLARTNFLTEAATARRRASDEWPSAARVTFTGWLPCPASTGGIAVINLDDSTAANATVGFPGGTGASTVNLGTARGDYGTSLIPHEFGHVLGFHHEQIRPDFDSTLACDEANVTGGNNLGTAPDVNSIMSSTGYCQNNPGLSPIDRQGVVVAYGARSNRFAVSTSWVSLSTSFTHAFADVSGDGRADIIGRATNGDVHVGTSTGTRFNAPTRWTAWDSRFSAQFADVNRDGRLDLIGRLGTDVQVALSTGSGFSTSTHWASWDTAYDLQLADMNGDGRADLVGRSGTDVQVALATGTGFASSTRWTTWVAGFSASFADVTGDGRADIIGRSGTTIRVGVSNGTSFLASSVWTTWGTAFDHRLADVNGDGKADLVGRSGDDVQVAISTGGVFATSTRWTRWSTSYDVNLGDADGDGRVDIVGRSGSDVQVGLTAN